MKTIKALLFIGNMMILVIFSTDLILYYQGEPGMFLNPIVNQPGVSWICSITALIGGGILLNETITKNKEQ